jgi:ATP-dependent protease HslVU (ClpYQ) peptidase subunit
MSVVVAIVRDGRVYLGCDSQVTRGTSRRSLSNPNNYKIWHIKGVNYCMLGAVGTVRESNIIKISSDLIDELAVIKEDINYDYVIKYMVPKLYDIVEKNKLLSKENDKYILNNSYLFAYRGRLFQIGTDGAVVEIDDFAAIGSGAPEALGSLTSTIKLNPELRIEYAIKASATNDIYVDYPIVIGNTTSKDFTVIFDEKKESIKSIKKNKAG